MLYNNQAQNKSNVCKFLVIPGRGPALLGVPCIKMLGFLGVECNTIGPRRHTLEIDEQSIPVQKGSNHDPMVSTNNKCKAEYFNAGP